jgi:hypothetical protein
MMPNLYRTILFDAIQKETQTSTDECLLRIDGILRDPDLNINIKEDDPEMGAKGGELMAPLLLAAQLGSARIVKALLQREMRLGLRGPDNAQLVEAIRLAQDKGFSQLAQAIQMNLDATPVDWKTVIAACDEAKQRQTQAVSRRP